MNPKTLIAMAVAGMFAITTGAFAGGKSHSPQSRVEVQTPSSVSEAGPSMSESIHRGGTSGIGATGSVTHDSSMATSETVEYWRMDEQPSGVGATPTAGASSTVGFDSSLGTSPD